MFDLPLATNLLLHTFSFKKRSLRFPTPKRLFGVLITLPFFFILILVNRMFMALDSIIFPAFKKLKLSSVVFITGVPRSATTYIYYLMAKDKNNFTCFKLWEILFAPSIIQKYFFYWMLKLDRLIGRPLYQASLFWDRIFLSQISRLHETSLSKPEEDEMLLLYAFASVYLAFFFPDVPALDPHLFFDEDLPTEKRKKIMLFYKQCVQRHVYFYDRFEKKFFLSKNPSFASKTTSLAETFPDARLIYMLRSPLQTIPSTISLNKNVYSIFSGSISTNPLAGKTKEIIIRWYQMADRSIAKWWQKRSITVPFKKITRAPAETILDIYEFLKLVPGNSMKNLLKIEQDNCANYVTSHEYHLEEDKDVARQLNFIFNGSFRDEI